jgi:hypothetical protein
MWKTYTKVRWVRLNSLIVVVICGHSWCLRGSRVLCCQVISLVRFILILISTTPLNMGDGLVAVPKRRSVILLYSYEIYNYV